MIRKLLFQLYNACILLLQHIKDKKSRVPEDYRPQVH